MNNSAYTQNPKKNDKNKESFMIRHAKFFIPLIICIIVISVFTYVYMKLNAANDKRATQTPPSSEQGIVSLTTTMQTTAAHTVQTTEQTTTITTQTEATTEQTTTTTAKPSTKKTTKKTTAKPTTTAKKIGYYVCDGCGYYYLSKEGTDKMHAHQDLQKAEGNTECKSFQYTLK